MTTPKNLFDNIPESKSPKDWMHSLTNLEGGKLVESFPL